MKKASYAMVTGASKGIGRAVAEELAQRGHNLILVARSESLLNELKAEWEAAHGVQILPYTADLTDREKLVALRDWCQAEGHGVHILVNNAGFGVYGSFAEASLEKMESMNALNVDAVVRLSYLMLPLLQAAEKGYLMNVGSMGAYQPIPSMSLYGAGKAYVRSFTLALRHELRAAKANVSVTCLSPGGVWTEFMKRADNEFVSERMKRFMMPADKCARIALNAMFRGKAEIIPGWYNKVGVWVTKHLPTRWTTNSAGKIFKPE